MPNLRTTIVRKKRVNQLVETDLIKIGGRWYSLQKIETTLNFDGRYHMILLPENDLNYDARLAIFAHGLVKFKVRTAK